MQARWLKAVCIILAFASCATEKSNSSCTEFKQAERNASLTIDIAEKFKAQGKIDSTKLIEVNQDAALYAKRLRDLCSFLANDKIKFPEYQEGVSKANQDYARIRTDLFQAAGEKDTEAPVDSDDAGGKK